MHRKRTIFFHVFSAVALAASVLVGCLCLTGVFWRTWEALRDMGLSVAYFFTRLFMLDIITPTVTTLPRDFFDGLPEAWDQFVPWAQAFGAQFITRGNVLAYLEHVLVGVGRFALVLAFCLPFLLLAAVLAWKFLTAKNTDHGKDSKPLTLFYAFRRKVLLRVKYFVLAYVKFLKHYKAYPIAFLCVWAYFFNVGTILLEFFAFLFYFAASFDLKGIFIMLLKLVSDLVPVFRFLPWWAWVIVGVFVLDYMRKGCAYKKLNGYEKKNREFIKSRPIVTMLCGSMRKKKTTIITDMQLSIQEGFREQALNDMRDIDAKFPFFPWLNFELFIKRTIRTRKTPTLASVELLMRQMGAVAECGDETTKRVYLRRLRRKYGYAHKDLFFGYDTSHGLTHANGLKEERLFDLLSEYGRLYYIYTNPTAIVSNYAVRSDKSMQDEGNFPRWQDDFFKRPTVTKKNSVMSHVLDFDALRLGRVSDNGNPFKDAFESGALGMTEIGKERGNQMDLKGLSTDADEVNQVNDLFNTELKMIGHSATVYYYPYVRFLCDDQRPESWGADARELCDIVDIVDGGSKKIILPFFALEEVFFLVADKIFRKIYDRYRFHRGDNTFTMYALKWLHGLVYNHYKRIENTFSVATATVTVQPGTMDEKRKKCKYYLCTKKIYADRFSTDCYHGFYLKKAARSKFGIMDIPQYKEIEPSFDELNGQKSHFIGKITKAFDGSLRQRKEKPKGGKK